MSIPADKLPQSPVERILTQAAPQAAAGAQAAPQAAPAQVEAPTGDTATDQAAFGRMAQQAQVNPYVAQIGQLTEQLQTGSQREQALENQLVENWVSGLPAEEQPRARAGYQLVRGMRDMATTLQDKDRYIQGLEAGVMPLIKREVIRQVSQREKVPMEILELAEDPRRDLPMLVNLYRSLSQKFAGQSRVETRVDAVPDAGSAAPGGTDRSEITAKYRNSGNLAAWFTEQAKAAR